MNLQKNISAFTIKAQAQIEKAKVLTEYILQDEDTSSKCYTCSYFINILLEEIEKVLQDIEEISYLYEGR